MKIKPIYYHYLALAGFLGLFVLLMLWYTILAPSAHFPVAMVLLIAVTPLLLPMQGLLARDLRACAWTAYLSLLYFMHGSGEAYANADERVYAALEILFSLMLFFGTTFYIRFAGKQL